MNDSLSIAKYVATQSGNLLAKKFNLSGSLAWRKADASLVTEADLAADQLIQNLIHQYQPEAAILSEENRTQIDEIPESLWIVDPLDGTTNFSLGLQYWGVSIAYLENGRLESAAIYFPLLDEMYTAAKGHGAWLNDTRLQELSGKNEASASFFSCCSRTIQHYQVNLPYKVRVLGSTAYSLCCVGRGNAIGSFDVTAKIWDIAAGYLILEETQGIAQSINGGDAFPLARGNDYAQKNFSVMSAANLSILNSLQTKIIPKP